MVGGSAFMRLFRMVFRDQKTRLQVDWLTHTDERILEYLAAGGHEQPSSIATDIDRSVEYVADRCRQLAIRGLLEERGHRDGAVSYALSPLGDRYLRGEVDADELDELSK